MSEAFQVQSVPIDSVRIVNPRSRDQRRFAQIVENIGQVGLKRPITVSPVPANNGGPPQFDLVCGQGRLEAYRSLGQSEIPAVVRPMSTTDALLASLIENIARRRVRPLDQLRLVQWMKDQGQEYAEIAAKTGLSESYVRDLLTMLSNGEDRLVTAVMHGRLPISVAIRIAGTSDEEAQRLLVEAYEAHEMTPKSLALFKKIVDHRRHFGRGFVPNRAGESGPTSTESLVLAYRRESERQRVLVKKAKLCEARLRSVTAAFRVLLQDDNFVTLLRAEKIETLPKFLIERTKEVA